MKNPLTLKAFADWCEKQPADKQYDYTDEHNCAMSQYVRSVGFATSKVVALLGSPYFVADGLEVYLPVEFNDAAIAGPETFGALAARLRTALSTATREQP